MLIVAVVTDRICIIQYVKVFIVFDSLSVASKVLLQSIMPEAKCPTTAVRKPRHKETNTYYARSPAQEDASKVSVRLSKPGALTVTVVRWL